jgi:hypothetical protein
MTFGILGLIVAPSMKGTTTLSITTQHNDIQHTELNRCNGINVTTTLNIMTLKMTTFNITTFIITTLNITTFIITTLKMTTFNITTLSVRTHS